MVIDSKAFRALALAAALALASAGSAAAAPTAPPTIQPKAVAPTPIPTPDRNCTVAATLLAQINALKAAAQAELALAETDESNGNETGAATAIQKATSDLEAITQPGPGGSASLYQSWQQDKSLCAAGK